MSLTTQRSLSLEATRPTLAPGLSRASLLAVMALAAVAAGFATNAETSANAIAEAGPDLTRLLRAMAGLKLLIAAPLAAAAMWRLATPISPAWFAAYATAFAAIAAGPALIWGMAHIGAGALLLHSGLAVALLVLWRDPAVAPRLAAAVAYRRGRLRTRA